MNRRNSGNSHQGLSFKNETKYLNGQPFIGYDDKSGVEVNCTNCIHRATSDHIPIPFTPDCKCSTAKTDFNIPLSVIMPKKIDSQPTAWYCKDYTLNPMLQTDSGPISGAFAD